MQTKSLEVPNVCSSVRPSVRLSVFQVFSISLNVVKPVH